MPVAIDYKDPRYAQSAGEMLRRHRSFESEANITSAVRDFLILTGLAKSHEIIEENPPSDSSRRAVDLTALDTFIEVKRRVGTAHGFDPNPEYVRQLDDYLAQSQQAGKGVRMGVLADGRHWLLRWPNAGQVTTVAPYAFVLDSPERWFLLYEWLRDEALVSLDEIRPDREAIAAHFGPDSPWYQRDLAALETLYESCAGYQTIQIKRQLWHDLLRTALGEIARTPEQMDDLFIRHTYLTAVIGMVVQASFGIDIRRMAASNPADLLIGRQFRGATGLQGVVESDFFAWPTEVGGLSLLTTIAHRVARFDWRNAPADIAAILYETVISPEVRRQLGEYYTPDWLARVMVRELVTDPLDQRVLDPACGSGTFVAEAVTHFIAAANESGLHPKQVLDKLRTAVTGIDVHPVSVHLARAAWTLAARPAINAAAESGFDASLTIPIYLGDALQLRFRTGDMFAEHDVRIQVGDEHNTELVFPVSLVERAEDFDALMGDIAEAIERGDDPYITLDDNHITEPNERQVLEQTIGTMRDLHTEGRDHIWAYYTRNLVRPVALSRAKVDVIVGNPPWLNYNQTVSTLRTELERQSKTIYGIWTGGRYATHQDVAGLFFARSTDLYLKDAGVIGMVMPHSALQAGQYAKWRTGLWEVGSGGSLVAVDFGYKTAWDLERLEPNTFFPVPASAVFARRVGEVAEARQLAGEVERWLGKAGAADVRREAVAITDTSAGSRSPYAIRARQGATIVPRRLFFVVETTNPAIVRAGQTVTVAPRRGAHDREPWRSLDLSEISGQTIEADHVHDVYLGETVVPYARLDPLKAILPVRLGDEEIPIDPSIMGGIRLSGLQRRMRDRWQTVSSLWEAHKQPVNKLSLLQRLDYHGELSAQLKWRRAPAGRPHRVVYTGISGIPTATVVDDKDALIDCGLYWIACKSVQEVNYVVCIINSQALGEAATPFMPKGQFGARDLHKHLWKLPIPEFDPAEELHVAISQAGEAAAAGAGRQLAQLRQERSRVTVTIARRELRKWLRESPEGRTVEEVVGRLLEDG